MDEDKPEGWTDRDEALARLTMGIGKLEFIFRSWADRLNAWIEKQNKEED